jgi:hypothetical protein
MINDRENLPYTSERPMLEEDPEQTDTSSDGVEDGDRGVTESLPQNHGISTTPPAITDDSDAQVFDEPEPSELDQTIEVGRETLDPTWLPSRYHPQQTTRGGTDRYNLRPSSQQ